MTVRAPLQRGFTMMEVLIALIILSIGLLGLAALQTTALRNNHGAYLRTQAILQAYDMSDRMRANDPAATSYIGIGASPIPTDPGCVLSGCTPSQMEVYDAYAWNTQNAALLPGGHGTVSLLPGSAGLYQITVQWNEGSSTNPESVSIDTQP